jgi:hypothetical protein
MACRGRWDISARASRSSSRSRLHVSTESNPPDQVDRVSHIGPCNRDIHRLNKDENLLPSFIREVFFHCSMRSRSRVSFPGVAHTKSSDNLFRMQSALSDTQYCICFQYWEANPGIGAHRSVFWGRDFTLGLFETIKPKAVNGSRMYPVIPWIDRSKAEIL